MSLDLSRLQKVRQHNGKTTAQCPACAEAGADNSGEHLAIFSGGKFACIMFQGGAPDAIQHRRRIHELAGSSSAEGPPVSQPAAKADRVTVDWTECCRLLLSDLPAQKRLAQWRGWPPAFCRTLPSVGIVGLHAGRIVFPVHDEAGAVTALHVFPWPGTSKAKAWYVNDGGNAPLIIGSADLNGAGEVNICESQWDALSLLCAQGWDGSPLASPFVVTRGTAIHPRLSPLLSSVQQIVLWPQNDSPKQDGSRPSETWVANLARVLPQSATPPLRVDMPSQAKDWNDVLRDHDAKETGRMARDARSAARSLPPPNLSTIQNEAPPSEELPTPEPLPHALPPVAAFDDAWLPASLRGWIADIAERMQCPPDFPAVAAMVALSSVAGRRFAIQPKAQDTGWYEHPHLWGMLVGRPSLMKSPAMQAVLHPLRLMEGKAIQDHGERERARLASELTLKLKREALTKKARAAIGKGEEFDVSALIGEGEGEAGPCRRFIVNNATIEALGEVLKDNPNGVMIYQDELSGLFALMDKECNMDLRAFLLTAWSGKEDFTFDRITRGTRRIEACAVALLGGIQPGVIASRFREAQDGGQGDDGFMQRFSLLTWPDVGSHWENIDRVPCKESQDEALAIYETMEGLAVSDLQRLAPLNDIGVPVFRFEPEAQECFTEWRTRLELRLRGDEIPPALESHLGKYRKLVPALAVLIHVAEWQVGGVALSALQRAIAWADYLETHAARAYGSRSVATAEAARHLLKKLLDGSAQFGAEFTARDVKRKGWKNLGMPEEARAACEMLVEFGWLLSRDFGTTEKGGRPTRLYRLNPAVYNGEFRA